MYVCVRAFVLRVYLGATDETSVHVCGCYFVHARVIYVREKYGVHVAVSFEDEACVVIAVWGCNTQISPLRVCA